MFDVRQFYEDYDIDTAPETHKHNRVGWVNTECPRCSGNPGYHLGFSEQTGQFVCWRCGFMPITEAVRLLTRVSWPEAKRIIKEYGGGKEYRRYERAPKEKDIDVEFPLGTLDHLPKRHREYLEDRDFDPDRLIDMWDLKATGNKAKGQNKNRIIVPIYYKNRLMSYQGRAIADNVDPKYKACDMENERRHHKYCLYGIDLAIGDSVLVLEGVTDVWRMGIGSVCTFGIKYKEIQVLLLARHFKNVFVMFDPREPAAQQQSKNLTMQLNAMGRKAEQITYDSDKDPASLSDDDAKYIMRELLIT